MTNRQADTQGDKAYHLIVTFGCLFKHLATSSCSFYSVTNLNWFNEFWSHPPYPSGPGQSRGWRHVSMGIEISLNWIKGMDIVKFEMWNFLKDSRVDDDWPWMSQQLTLPLSGPHEDISQFPFLPFFLPPCIIYLNLGNSSYA